MIIRKTVGNARMRLWRRAKRSPRTYQTFYNIVARLTMGERNWGLMNFGYAFPEDSMRLEMTPEEEPERYGLQMYYKVIGDTDLKDRKVLEVGCGRGGGAKFVAERFDPTCLVGVDLSKEVIRFCERTHNDSRLQFRPDNAMDLSFEDNDFDVVFNIESSYCYPDKKKFFQEVYRVLKPGGVFNYADNFAARNWPEIQSELLSAGFTVRRTEDISSGVVKAIERDAERRRALIRRLAPWPFKSIVDDWAGLPGGSVHTRLQDGKTLYRIFIAEKPPDSKGPHV